MSSSGVGDCNKGVHVSVAAMVMHSQGVTRNMTHGIACWWQQQAHTLQQKTLVVLISTLSFHLFLVENILCRAAFCLMRSLVQTKLQQTSQFFFVDTVKG